MILVQITRNFVLRHREATNKRLNNLGSLKLKRCIKDVLTDHQCL